MKKWLGGCLVVAIVVILAAAWFGMRTMKKSLASDGSAAVTIAASPSRVFASVANGDSMRLWMAPRGRFTVSRHGQLMRGDIIRTQLRSMPGLPQQAMTWEVTDVVQDHAFALQLHDSTGRITLVRRDSLIPKGDSTTVVSRVTSHLDSAGAARDSADKARGGLTDMTAGVMLSMFRMQGKLELDMLKSRIEGRPRK
jgi:uncharacterized protein YndB with AHSA1/START domain